MLRCCDYCLAPPTKFSSDTAVQSIPVNLDKLEVLGIDQVGQTLKVVERRNAFATQELRVELQFHAIDSQLLFLITAHKFIRLSSAEIKNVCALLFAAATLSE